jgi:O-antigen ligase
MGHSGPAPTSASDGPSGSDAGPLLFGRWPYSAVNRYYTALAFGAAPVAGSAVSFIFNGGAVWSLFEVARGKLRASRETHVLWMTAALYGYCASMIIAALINPGVADSFLKLPGLITLALFPFSYASWRLCDKDAMMRMAILASAWACLIGFAVAAIEITLLGSTRASGGAGNALMFASVMALAGAVCLAGVIDFRGRARLVCAVGFVAAIAAIFLSASRGPLILIGVSSLIVAAVHGGRSALYRALAVAAIGIAGVGAITASGLTTLGNRFADIWTGLQGMFGGLFNTSEGLRIAMWEIGAKLFLEKPIFGHGAGSIERLIEENMQADYGLARSFGHFHNVFLNTLVEGGLLGLAALSAMLAVPAIVAIKVLSAPSQQHERFGATMLLLILAHFAVSGFTNLVLRHDIMDAIFMVFVVSGLYLAAGRTPVFHAQQNEKKGVSSSR